MRKTPINWTEKTPRLSKYSKENTEKDPYPCLDEKDPRILMTDKELLEGTSVLCDACVTEKQKEAVYKILLKYREAVSLSSLSGAMV